MSLLFDAEAAAEQLRIADDAELLERSRRGDSVAFAELFRRYRPVALMVAARTSSALDPEDVSSEAFTRVWRALRNGGGPAESFRPYLSTSVRNVALNWRRGVQETPLEPQAMAEVLEAPDETEVVIAEAEMIGRAFRGLPQRWQDVLWAVEVEGMSTADLAKRLGTSNNTAAALCLRAREGLRNAWLAEHIDRRAAEPECRWVLEHLSGFTRGRLPQAQQQRVTEHLDECRRCRRAASRLDRVVAVLRISVIAGGTSAGLLGASSLATGAAGAKVAAASIQPSGWVARVAKVLLQPQVGLAAVVGTVAVVSLGLSANLSETASAASIDRALQPSVVVLPPPAASAEPVSQPTAVQPSQTAAAMPTAEVRMPAEEPPRSPSASPVASPSVDPQPSPSVEPTLAPSPSVEPSPSVAPSPSIEPSPRTEPTVTASPSVEPSLTPTPTPSEPTPTPSDPTPSLEPSPTPSGPEPSVSPSATPSATAEPSPSGAPSIEPSPSATVGPTDSSTPTESASPTPSVSPSAPPSETASPQPSPTPSCVLIWDFLLRIGICRA